MADKPLFVYVAAYNSIDDAKADYDAVKQLHRDKVIGTYDAALISKDDDGNVHVRQREKPTEHGIEAGAAAGAIVGFFFPPFLLADAALGAAAGGVINHLRKGLPRRDMKEIGDLLNAGNAALIVVGESKLDEALQKAVKRASKTIEKQVNADAKQFNADLDAAVSAATQSQ